MSRPPRVAWIDGTVVPFSEARIPIEDRGLQFGESLYEVVAVTAGKPRLLAEHGARMRAGAEALALEGAPSDEVWESIAAALAREDALSEGLLYAQLTGGTAPRRHVPEATPRPVLFAYQRPYRFPRANEVDAGVRAITLPDLRWGRCDLKTTMLLPAVWAKREAERQGAGEALFVSETGELREGASSNLFLVRDGRLVTPAQTRHLLPGLTRPLVASIAEEAGRTVVSEVITRATLATAEEVFVVSTAVLLMPVTHVDRAPIADGRPGPWAADLATRLRRRWELD